MPLPVDATTLNHPDIVETQVIRVPTLIGTIYVDAVLVETPSAPVSVTTHPVEDGSEISDFAIDEQRTLSLDCKFVDDDFGWIGASKADREQKLGKGLTTAVDKEQAVEALKANKTLVDVSTEKQLYLDMLLIDIQPIRTVQTAKSFTAMLTFVGIEMVAFETAEVDVKLLRDQNVPKKKAKKKNKGKVDGVTPDASAQAEYESILNSLVGG